MGRVVLCSGAHGPGFAARFPIAADTPACRLLTVVLLAPEAARLELLPEALDVALLLWRGIKDTNEGAREEEGSGSVAGRRGAARSAGNAPAAVGG